MEKRTAEIIMICKGRHKFGDDLCAKAAIKAYICDRCAIAPEHSQIRDVNDIIWTAALDYMNSASKPSFFISSAKEIYDRAHSSALGKNTDPIDIYEAICRAFRLVRVKADDGQFINGFCEEYTQEVKMEH